MADTTIPVPSFDLGIQGGAEYGNIQDAEAFLSGETLIDEELEKVDLKKEEKKEEKKVEKTEPKIELTADEALGEDEDEEEEDPKKKTIKDAIADTEEEDENPFVNLSAELYKAGVFTLGEGEEPVVTESPEEFLKLFNEEKQKGASAWLEGYLARFGEDRREMFEAVFVNGVDPKEYLPIFNQVQDFESLDLEDEGNQEMVVRSYYKKTGLTDSQIESKITKLKSFADLEDEAKMFHPLIVAQDKQKLTELADNAAREQKAIIDADTEYKTSISKVLQDKLVDKNIDGIPLTEKDAQKTFDFLYSKKWKTKSGELLTDWDKFIMDTKHPDNHALRVKMALLALNNFDLSKVEKKAISKESNTLFSSLASKKEKKSNTQPAKSGWGNL